MHAMVVTFVVRLLLLLLLLFFFLRKFPILIKTLFFYSVESHLRKMAGSTLPYQLKARVLCFTRSEK